VARRSITSTLFRLARLSADVRSVKQSVKTGSPKPIVRRIVNKWLGRNIHSKGWWR